MARNPKPVVVEGERVVVPSGGVGDGTIEKRTRFSLSHDEGSIGNTSDNLEAISEAASNHSVASSMDDVEQVSIVFLVLNIWELTFLKLNYINGIVS